MNPARRLRPLTHGTPEFGAFLAALSLAHLPGSDVEERGRYFALESDEEVVGFGGLDGSGSDQMIRSVVVRPDLRGRGYGRDLVERLIRQAEADGATRVWLLTTSTPEFFASLGWNREDRASAPEAVKRSPQFQGLCSSSAVLMSRHLGLVSEPLGTESA